MIHHLFPGRAEHHIPSMIQFLQTVQEEIGSHCESHVYAFYNSDPAQLARYRQIVPPNCRIIAVGAGRAAIFKYLRSLGPAESLVLHSAFFPSIWTSLLLLPRLWKRTSWIMWGADIAGLDSLKGKLYRKLKGIVIPRLGAVSALVPGDFEELQKFIGPCSNYVRAIYAPEFHVPPQPKQIDGAHGTTRVVVGNSAWEQNDHAPVFEWLSRFADQNLEVICPLGYPRESPYKDATLAAGRQWLGDQFQPIEGMMERDAYHLMLAEADIFIINTRNQQGLGNIYNMLATGGKVFVRGDSPTYSMLKSFDFHVFDTRDLSHISFSEMIRYSDREAEHNRAQFELHLSTRANLRQWETFLSKIVVTEKAA